MKATIVLLTGLACAAFVPLAATAQEAQRPTAVQAGTDPLQTAPPDVLTGAIDNRAVVALPASVPPQARSEYDAGRAPSGLSMPRMTLVLRRSRTQQAALDALVAAQQNPRSPRYHTWLTPEEFGAHFGLSENDLNKLAGWLRQSGFRVDEIPPGRWTIVFSGTTGQVESAFHTEMRYYTVAGTRHRANSIPLEIPKALAPVVTGILGIHDFEPVPTVHEGREPHFGGGSTGTHYLFPVDMAAIYNINPLYSLGVNGAGETIAIVGRCIIDPSVVQTFRALVGLPVNDTSVTVVGEPPAPCSGTELLEPYLDVEWAGAVAKNARIVLVVAGSVRDSASYIVNHNLAPVMSTSFGSCEANNLGGGNEFLVNLWEQAASSGITSLVSSGDSGAAECDSAGSDTAVHGLGVNAWCSPPYATCVGGTQFDDRSNPSLYWSFEGYAMGYIPEQAWNESGSHGGRGLWSSGGGISNVYPTPIWQGVLLARGVPDVSLTAAAHDGYFVCMDSTCNLSSFHYASGTSASAPSFAGLMALLVQHTGERQGAANEALYALQSHSGVFHDITLGDNSVPGQVGYFASVGWDAVTGLGSVDATEMVTHWGSGVISAPSVLLSSSSVAFGDHFIGSTSTVQVVTLTNDGDATLNISSIYLQGANTSDFPTTTSCENPGTLDAGHSCNFSIAFHPSAAGLRTASIAISDDAADSPQTISLSGTGTASAGTPPTVIQALTSNISGLATGSCVTPPPVTSFSVTAPAVWLYYDLSGVNMGDTLLMSFIRPDGVAYTNLTSISDYNGNVCFSYHLDIAGTPAASYPGRWTIRVYWNQVPASLFVLNFTLTPAVIQPTSVLPQFGVGAGFVTDFYVVNGGTSSASFSIDFHDDNGDDVSLPFAGLGSLSTLADSVPAGGSAFYEAGTPGGTAIFGSGMVTADPSITVQALFRRQGSDGSYYEAAVPAAGGSLEVAVPFDATTFSSNGSQIYTGLAIANLDPSHTAHVSCTARDSDGDVIPGAITVPALNPWGHWSGYLFPALVGRRGTFDCISNTQIGAIGTRALGYNALSSLPVIALPGASPQSMKVLPQFGVGAGFVTDFYVVNSGISTASFSISFFDDNGNSVAVPLDGPLHYHAFGASLPAGGARFYEAGTPSGTPIFGSAIVVTDPDITVQALFRRQGSDGSYYEAAVPTANGSLEVQVPFDATMFGGNGSQIYTGLAIANLDQYHSANVSCTARDSTGAVIPGAITVPVLNPWGHWSGYLFPALVGRRGTFDCISNTLIGAIGTRALGYNALSSLPVITPQPTMPPAGSAISQAPR